MIDTHTHLYLPEFTDDGDSQAGQSAAVERALKAGVDTMIFPNVGLDTIAPMYAVAAAWPANTRMAMGLHPTEIKEDYEQDLERIIDELHNPQTVQYVAVGEVGIDLYWDRTFERQQMEALDRQAAEAVRAGLPLILHCREGLDQTLDVLSGHRGARFLFHSFGGSENDVERIRRTLGDACLFGINGIVTFKNSTLREVLPAIGLDHIVTETDSPYLAPVPYRGKRNESSYVPLIVDAIAVALSVDRDEVSETTSATAKEFFRLNSGN